MLNPLSSQRARPAPLTLSPLARPRPWIPAGALGGRIQTVLLVEDSRHAAEAIRLLARPLALRLRRAESLAAGRKHLRLYLPDMVLLDPGLPDGDGLSLIEDVRRLESGLLCAPRVVVISADPLQEDAALQAGADAFVLKPARRGEDLARLFGPEVPVNTAFERHQPEIDGLTLSDDLRLAQDLIERDPNQLGYVLRFLQGIASANGDRVLGRIVAQAHRQRDPAPLKTYLAERLCRSELM